MENQNDYNRQTEEETREKKKTGREGRGSFWIGALTGSLVTAFAGLLIVGMAMAVQLVGKVVLSETQTTQQTAGPDITTGQEHRELDYDSLTAKMSLIQQIIDKFFLYEEDFDQVQEYVYKGMLVGLGDPYTEYYTAEEYKKLQEDTIGVYGGIGAMLLQNAETGICTISRVFKDSPAEEAGMRPGDILYKVGDKLATGQLLSVMINEDIKGPEGSQVTITVYRQETNEYLDLVITRRNIEVPTVSYEMLANKVGYIQISQFEMVTAQQFRDAVDDLKAQGMTSLVLDLRSNPGGLIKSAVEIADYLLADDLKQYDDSDDGTLLVYTADKNGQGTSYRCSDGHQEDFPMAVLVNENSASASEIVTGALKDYHRAQIVGTTTYGKGVVQNLIPLGADGSAIKLTMAHYYTPSGYDLHGRGIDPDVEAELDRSLQSRVRVELEQDNQVQAALKALETETQ